jgi:hypothetical protein
MSLSFVYGQGAIVQAMMREGAGEISATFAVWAVGLFGGSVLSVLYPAWIMTRKKSWGVLWQSGRELLLAAIIGLNVSAGVALLGHGMLMLGALGASAGWGIQQASWMLGGQVVGFVSGEWRGVHGAPQAQMGLAIALLVAAAAIMAYGNTLAPKTSHLGKSNVCGYEWRGS